MSRQAPPEVLVVMPAYNVAHVIEKAVMAIPEGVADAILVVDDGSSDGTADVARELGCMVITHPENRGYGGAQKTGYKEAIRLGATMTVMVHGDNQYDPTFVPEFVAKIRDEGYDAVTGTRMVLGDVLESGMPIWKFIPNRFLTWLENTVFQTDLTDYHNGYRAFRVDFLRQVPLDLLSNRFDFDTDIIIQAAIRGARIAEVPHPTRYEDENSQMPFSKGVIYGLSILRTVARYLLHKLGIWRQELFEGA